VLEVYCRKAAGWAFGQPKPADVVIAALDMAQITGKLQGLIHRFDQVNHGGFKSSSQSIPNGRAPVEGKRGRCLRQHHG
jgi:hypothetical protein